MSNRIAEKSRFTTETTVRARLNLDGDGAAQIATGLGFLDHMLTAFTRHARLDLDLTCTGDLHIDDHHSVEDCALVLGAALDEALGERRGVARFGAAYAPLDESLSRVVIDLSGRPGAFIDLGLAREMLGDVASENIAHFFTSLAIASRMTLHVDVLKGSNDHHRTESAFKAAALALRQAVVRKSSEAIPSTKGTLS